MTMVSLVLLSYKAATNSCNDLYRPSAYFIFILMAAMLYIVLHCLALGLRPKPPTQTAVQAAVVANKSIIAKNASLNAIPSLLAHLDSPLSRSALAHDCPALANASAAEILRRLVAEIEVAEPIETDVAPLPARPSSELRDEQQDEESGSSVLTLRRAAPSQQGT